MSSADYVAIIGALAAAVVSILNAWRHAQLAARVDQHDQMLGKQANTSHRSSK